MTSKLPDVMCFERIPGSPRATDCYWKRVAFRRPKKGEWYVSGAIPMAYLAPNDLPYEYLVVVPTHKAKLVTKHERGDVIVPGRVRA